MFDAAWLAELPTPTPEQHDAGQVIALVDGEDFARFDGPEQVRDGYHQHNRTYLFEGINGNHAWAHLASRWLGALSGSDLTVLVDLFDSRHGDARFGTHYDCWFNVSIQLSGTKHWRVGPGLNRPGQEITDYTLNPGDVLVIPHDVPHDVQTPTDPGHSRHLIFTIDRREPEQPAALLTDAARNDPCRRLRGHARPHAEPSRRVTGWIQYAFSWRAELLSTCRI